MDIKSVLREYDSLFSKREPEEINNFLLEQIKIAQEENDQYALLTLLNEQIGFCRETNQKDLCLQSCKRLYELTFQLYLDGTVKYGTILLNIANSYRVFGKHEEAGQLFQEVEDVYLQNLEKGSYEFAPLYNNWGLLYISMGNQTKAIEMLKKTLAVIDNYEQAGVKRATTRTNLASAIMTLPDGDMHEAEKLLDEAVVLFEQYNPKDFHYSGALTAKGNLLLKKGLYAEAIDNYESASAIIRMYFGDTGKTDVLAAKIANVKKLMGG